MTVTIYVTKEAMTTITAIKDLDYYDRCSLADVEATDPTHKEGYYLKINHNNLNVAALPEGAAIIARLLTSDYAAYSGHVTMPTHLRGCLFEKAPHLPKDFKKIINHWSGEPLNTNGGGAAYYQNPMNSYMIDLSALDAEYEAGNYSGNVPAMDALVSEGIVVHISGLGGLISEASDDGFFEIEIPVDDALLALDNPDFRTERPYNQPPGERTERIFLRLSDVRKSPDPNNIFIDALRYEEIDYGFYY